MGNFWAWESNMEPTKEPKDLNVNCMMHTQKFHTKRQRKGNRVLNEILFKTMSKSFFFLPHKGGTPQKHFPVRFPLFFRVRQLWATRGNLFTWNLIVPLMLLPGKTNLLEICCCGKFLGLGNKHGTHEGAKRFEC